MRRFQFTLLGLFGLLTAAALGCAALMHPTALWCSAVAIAVVTVLFAAVLGVVYRRGADRAFWVGFAVFGWGYLMLNYGPILPIYSPEPDGGGFTMTSAVSSGPIVNLYQLLHGELPQGGLRGMGGMGIFSVPSEEPAGEKENPFVDPKEVIPGVPPAGLVVNPPAATGDPAADDLVSFGHFNIIANLLASMIFALLGGILAKWFHATQERATVTPRPAGEP